jgi:c-di-AMP phosphodiesterase-like protein
MLSLAGVDASLDLYQTEDGAAISARSMGVRNVQVIMEALGGGGHQTMAAAQIDHTTLAAARQKLIEVIAAQTAAN